MLYDQCIKVLKRREYKMKGYWAIYVCCDCDCNFMVYNTVCAGSWNCPSCKSEEIIRLRENKVEDGDYNRTAQEFIDMSRFDKVHLKVTQKGE